MKKIRLNVEKLAVDSFVMTSEDAPKRGTVHGRDDSDNPTYDGDFSCSGDHNCLCPLTYPQPCG